MTVTVNFGFTVNDVKRVLRDAGFQASTDRHGGYFVHRQIPLHGGKVEVAAHGYSYTNGEVKTKLAEYQRALEAAGYKVFNNGVTKLIVSAAE